MKQRIRPLGDITADIEPLIEEMCVAHDLQHGEVMALIHIHLTIHHPASREEYTSGGHPEFYYGVKR